MPVDLAQNEALRRRLRTTLLVARTRAQGAYEVVVTCNEVNDRYGTGILVQRLFPDQRRVLSIRACNHYGGEQAFGDVQLVVPEHCSDRASIYRWTLAMVDGLPIDRVVCVSFQPTELIVSMALRDAYQVPFCLYVMDDQNVHAAGISDALMDEAVAVVIAQRHPFIEQHFGDSVLFRDESRPADEEVVRCMEWIRGHPAECAQLTARAHRVLAERFTLERLLSRLPSAHRRFLAWAGR